MIQSMTAFARESAETGQGTLTIELRSVNHRYLDCSFKLPDITARPRTKIAGARSASSRQRQSRVHDPPAGRSCTRGAGAY